MGGDLGKKLRNVDNVVAFLCFLCFFFVVQFVLFLLKKVTLFISPLVKM